MTDAAWELSEPPEGRQWESKETSWLSVRQVGKAKRLRGYAAGVDTKGGIMWDNDMEEEDCGLSDAEKRARHAHLA